MNIRRIDPKKFFLILGPVVYLLCIFFLPQTIFETLKQRTAVGIVSWMTLWWVTSPVDYGVTALLPVALNAIIPVADMNAVVAGYASETIILLLGASILTASWSETGLDKRIATCFLGLIGNSMRNQVIFWFLLTAVLSAVLPNAVVCAAITPVAVSMLNCCGEKEISKSQKASRILLTIAYGTGVGGLASPLGGAMNLVVVDYIQKLTGKEYMYSTWVVKFFPVMILLTVTNLLFMIRDTGNEKLGSAKEYFQNKKRKMNKMSSGEKKLLLLFGTATVLAFGRQLYEKILPGLQPSYVFLICGIFSFLITDQNKKPLQTWKTVQKKILWELMLIFGGGLALGTLLNDSGAATSIGNWIAASNMKGGMGTVFVIVTFTLLLSDVTSNTATAAIAIPIAISVLQRAGRDPLPYLYLATAGVNLSYMFPTSIRAIPVGYGLSPGYMLKEGWKLTIMMIFMMTIVGTGMIQMKIF